MGVDRELVAQVQHRPDGDPAVPEQLRDLLHRDHPDGAGTAVPPHTATPVPDRSDSSLIRT